ncbi:hypothetical protein D3C72_1453920 [compost metagenome]
MCTISETKVTTTIIIAVSESTRKPTSIFRLPMAIHSYTVPLKPAPFITSSSTITDSTKEMATPRIVAVCATILPPRDSEENRSKNLVPNRPAIAEPTSGASGIASSRLGLSVVAIGRLVVCGR